MLDQFPVVRVTLEQIADIRAEVDLKRKLPVGLQLDEFLNQFPTVTREQALAVLEESKERLILGYESAA